jgi:peptidoglycan/LPS O-acetylase OafA/YrhL
MQEMHTNFQKLERRKAPMSDRQHFATLDGLRGVAAIVVVASHCIDPFDLTALIPHARLAVDFFFCLSGFVVCYAYEKRLLGTMSFAEFVAVRLIRLYPLILAGCLLGALAFVAKTAMAHQSPFTSNFVIVVVLEALLIPSPFNLGQGWGSIAPLDTPAWSLFYEFVANFAYAALVARLTKPVMIFCLVGGAIAIFVQDYIMNGVPGSEQWGDMYQGLIRVFYPFLCGVFLFRRWELRYRLWRPMIPFILPILLLAVLLSPVPTSVKWLYESSVSVAVLPLIVAIGALDEPGPRVTAFYLFLGRLSYPLYILHYPLVHVFSNFARLYAPHGLLFFLIIVVEILVAIGVSIVMLKLVDEPVRAWLNAKLRLASRTINTRLTIPDRLTP